MFPWTVCSLWGPSSQAVAQMRELQGCSMALILIPHFFLHSKAHWEHKWGEGTHYWDNIAIHHKTYKKWILCHIWYLNIFPNNHQPASFATGGGTMVRVHSFRHLDVVDLPCQQVNFLSTNATCNHPYIGCSLTLHIFLKTWRSFIRCNVALTSFCSTVFIQYLFIYFFGSPVRLVGS